MVGVTSTPCDFSQVCTLGHGTLFGMFFPRAAGAAKCPRLPGGRRECPLSAPRWQAARGRGRDAPQGCLCGTSDGDPGPAGAASGVGAVTSTSGFGAAGAAAPG